MLKPTPAMIILILLVPLTPSPKRCVAEVPNIWNSWDVPVIKPAERVTVQPYAGLERVERVARRNSSPGIEAYVPYDPPSDASAHDNPIAHDNRLADASQIAAPVRGGGDAEPGLTADGAPTSPNFSATNFAANRLAMSRRWRPFDDALSFNGPDIGGWCAWGLYNNSHGASGDGNAPLGFNNLAKELQLHQAWVYATREARVGDGFDWGYRFDALFGSDGPNTTAFGDQSWDFAWTTSNQYGFAIPQLYLEFALQRLDVIVGHFYTIIGYEVVQAPNNFFYSHSYAFAYNQPLTHTGVLANYAVTDTIKLYGGWTAGWDTGFSNGNQGSSFLGGIGWSPSEAFSLIYATSFGDPGDDPTLTSSNYLHSVVMNLSISQNWEYVFANNFQTRDSDVADGKAYGIGQYLFYRMNDRWRAGMRYEWFRDSRGDNAVGGRSQHLHAMTFGLNRAAGSFIFRPEVRYDWSDVDDVSGPGGSFSNGNRRSQATYGMSGIWMF